MLIFLPFSLEIGLFSLVGIAGVVVTPITGRIVDRLGPWNGLLISNIILAVASAIFTGAGGVSIIAIIFVIFRTHPSPFLEWPTFITNPVAS